MPLHRTLFLAPAVLAIALLSGCDGKSGADTMPEVNDENCQDANILKIRDKEMRQEFAGKCLRRGGFKPSPPHAW